MTKVIALAGNPNSGKTTLFNRLTGAIQHVANYPGVTVEKKSGFCSIHNTKYEVVDLPGTYSLSAYSEEEVVTRNYLIEEEPEALINVVDSTNLERNLSLTVQLLEMGIPTCIAVNLIDAAKTRGIFVNCDSLSELMGVPVVPISARNGTGIDNLGDITQDLSDTCSPIEVFYGSDIEGAIEKMLPIIEADDFLSKSLPPRWTALKYLEEDEITIGLGDKNSPEASTKLKLIVEKVAKHLDETLNTYPEAVIADYRYGHIRSIIKSVITIKEENQDRVFLSEKIDNILLNRFFGPIIMVGIIFLLYYMTFTLSQWPVKWLESLFGSISGFASATLPDGILKSLIVSGVVDGVGGVLGFTPLILFMFFGIAILEDTGYLTRMSFMLDRLFSFFGLHGNSVMPFIISGGIAGGCAVPGVMATRTIKSPKERLATMLTAPFMNCGAKLPIFALLVAAFFTENQAYVMLTITLISWIGALLAAKILRLTVLKGENSPFVMELPPYRLPTLRGLFMHTWEKVWQYVKKAGTTILAISILLWAMMTFPSLPEADQKIFADKKEQIEKQYSAPVIKEYNSDIPIENMSSSALELKEKIKKIELSKGELQLRKSAAGRFGSLLEPITSYAGFDWRTNIALTGGFAAKEVVVSTLGTAYSLGEVDTEDSVTLGTRLKNSPSWSKATAWSLIIFTIFYAPCFVTVVCIAKESGSWKWGVFSIIFNTSIAFVLSVVVFQICSA